MERGGWAILPPQDGFGQALGKAASIGAIPGEILPGSPDRAQDWQPRSGLGVIDLILPPTLLNPATISQSLRLFQHLLVHCQ